MRIGAIGALLLAGVGCITQTSLQPLFTKEDCETVPGIEGTWVGEGDGDGDDEHAVMTLRLLESGEHEMTLPADGRKRPGRFAVRFGRIQGDLYWDLTAMPLDRENDLWGLHRLSVHSFARVRLQDTSLEIAFVDLDWVKRALDEGKLAVAHVQADGDLLLTASPEALRQLVSEHADDPGFFAEPMLFRRATLDLR